MLPTYLPIRPNYGARSLPAAVTSGAIAPKEGAFKLKDLLKPVLSIGGALLGGPIGGALGNIGSAIPTRAPTPAPFLPQRFSASPGTGVSLASQLGAGPLVSSVVRTAAATGGGLVKLAGAAGRSIWKVVLPSGKIVTRKNAVALARRIGLESAAVALGISAVEMAGAIAEESTRRRRGRGITGRDIAVVRRTARKLNSAACALASIPRPSVRARTARTCK